MGFIHLKLVRDFKITTVKGEEGKVYASSAQKWYEHVN